MQNRCIKKLQKRKKKWDEKAIKKAIKEIPFKEQKNNAGTTKRELSMLQATLQSHKNWFYIQAH